MVEVFFHWQHITNWEFYSAYTSDDKDICTKLTIHLHKAICLQHRKMQTEMGTQTRRHSLLPMLQ